MNIGQVTGLEEGLRRWRTLKALPGIPLVWEGVQYADWRCMEPWTREALERHVREGGKVPFNTKPYTKKHQA